jgi:hypothetical protein
MIRIAITPAAYAAIAETLKARCLPGPGESVSDVILRLAGAGAVNISNDRRSRISAN